MSSLPVAVLYLIALLAFIFLLWLIFRKKEKFGVAESLTVLTIVITLILALREDGPLATTNSIAEEATPTIAVTSPPTATTSFNPSPETQSPPTSTSEPSSPTPEPSLTPEPPTATQEPSPTPTLTTTPTATTPPPTNTPTETPIPTSTPSPTPPGVGFAFGTEFQVVLNSYEFRSDSNTTDLGAVGLVLDFVNNTDQEVAVVMNWLEVEGVDNVGTEYGERFSVGARHCAAGIGCIIGAPDADKLGDHRFTVPPHSHEAFNIELHIEGIAEYDMTRVDIRTDWIDLVIPHVVYRTDQAHELSAKWRLVR